MGRSIVFAALLSVLLSSLCAAQVWFVKPDGTGAAPTIQAAVDSSVSGDTVLLAKGVYAGDGNRDIDLSGKTVTVISISGDPETCIIDCGGSETEHHRAFDVYGNSTIEGIKIVNGFMEWGGALYVARGTIRNCVLEANYASHSGGGIQASGADQLVEDCVFIENSAGNCGGAIVADPYGAGLVVSGCVFLGNHSFWNASAICPWGQFTRVYVEFSTFASNWTSAPYASTIGADNWSPDAIHEIIISSCTFAGNQGGIEGLAEGGENAVERTIITSTAKGDPIIGCMSLSCCDIYGNAEGDWVGCIEGQLGSNGNFSEDPLFCDPGNGDYTLLETSPCAPAGSPPGCELIGAHPVGCANAGVEPGRFEARTWGEIKAIYR